MEYANIIFLRDGADPTDYKQEDVVCTQTNLPISIDGVWVNLTNPVTNKTKRYTPNTILQIDLRLDKKETEQLQKKYAGKQPEKIYWWKTGVEIQHTPQFTKEKRAYFLDQETYVTHITLPGKKPVGRTVYIEEQTNHYLICYLTTLQDKLIIPLRHLVGGDRE